ncbi:MAG: HEPN domain-containing protein, partial [Lutibacter sp.]
DMVSYSICKNSQIAIENFFKGYLTKNKIAIAPDETIDTLFKKCIGFNEKFKEIDLAALSCKGHVIDSRYCSDISKVTSCFDTADAIDTFFRKNKII